jgi:hypothetical protein
MTMICRRAARRLRPPSDTNGIIATVRTTVAARRRRVHTSLALFQQQQHLHQQQPHVLVFSMGRYPSSSFASSLSRRFSWMIAPSSPPSLVSSVGSSGASRRLLATSAAASSPSAAAASSSRTAALRSYRCWLFYPVLGGITIATVGGIAYFYHFVGGSTEGLVRSLSFYSYAIPKVRSSTTSFTICMCVRASVCLSLLSIYSFFSMISAIKFHFALFLHPFLFHTI